MFLMIGKTLGNFTLEARIGKGGMGEVYKAKDQKLGRDVAIKVLPEEFANDADRVARFQREAKLLASLNHPNIAAIYGLEESDGMHFLVLELIEGDTLADRIKSGPIPVEEALKLALQITEALEAAHEKGIIHRDLKPANIKVTPDGKVKVLDFGLAKAFVGEQGEMNLSNSPTLSVAATQQGIILGTAAYMSPEQASGEMTDKRTDIWAFGVVLFEMLTGRSLFEGNNVSQTLASVIKSEPEWKSLPSNLHPRIRLLLGRSLKKEPKNRYHDIADARVDIQEVLADPSGVFVQPSVMAKPRRKLRLGLPWVAAITIFGIIVAGVAVWKLKPSEPRQVVRFEYDLPEAQQFTDPGNDSIAVSVDGKQLVYSTPGGLYLRSVDELEAKLIVGTEMNPSSPFFSPDGKWVGYWSAADGKLKKIAIGGGAPVILCDVAGPAGASWNTDNTIVYSELSKGIMRVSANGGNPELLVKPSTGVIFSGSPKILPDKKTLLFTDVMPSKNQVVVQSLESGERKVLIEGGDVAFYLSTGHLVYMMGNNLYAIPFDLSRLEVSGDTIPMVVGVFRIGRTSVPQIAVSNSGTLVYVPGEAGSGGIQRNLVWVDRNGKEEPLAAQPNDYRFPRISPDGTKVAMAIYAGEKSDIWIWDIVRGAMTRLTFNGAGGNPLWSLDGQRVAFGSGYPPAVYWKAADGTGVDEKLGSVPDGTIIPWSWSKDGKTLVALEWNANAGFDIGSMSMEGDHEWKPLLQEKYVESQPEISPDGRWMAYTSDESGKYEVFVRSFPDVDKGRWQISTAGGDTPLWSPNGREIFYRNGDEVIAVVVETEPTFKAGKPESLFSGTYTSSSTAEFHPWDISHDGKHFLMMKEVTSDGTAASGGPRKINIVVNWIEELKQKVPAK